MKKSKILPLISILGIGLIAAPVSADIIDIIGDIDNLGGAIAGGAIIFPSTTFDNRSGAEAAATDGSQLTDWSNTPFGVNFANPTFFHTFAAFSSITSAVWEIGVGGIQSLNDRLFLDGILIASGMDFPEQGPNGYGIVSFNIVGGALSELLDGIASFRVNLNSNNSGEPVVFDYARLSIVGVERSVSVPEPGTLALLGIGLAGMGLIRRRRTA